MEQKKEKMTSEKEKVALKMIKSIGSNKQAGLIFIAGSIKKEGKTGFDCLIYGNNISKFGVLKAFEHGLGITSFDRAMNAMSELEKAMGGHKKREKKLAGKKK